MLSCDCHVMLTSAHLQTAPLDLYLRKYGVASKRTIPSENIARYGRQILEVPHAVTAHLPPANHTDMLCCVSWHLVCFCRLCSF